MTDKPIYHLNLTVSGCRARALVNGFPVTAVDSALTPLASSPPINPFLVGAGNTLSIEAMASERGPSTPMGASVTAYVAAFAEGDIVAPGKSGDILLELELDKALEEQGIKREERAFPLRVEASFDTRGPNFRSRFLDAEPIRDEGAVVDYAIFLRDLCRANDVDAIVREFAPKLSDYAAAYYEDAATMPAEFADYLRNALLPAPLDLHFEHDDILLEPCSGGRLYKISFRTSDALLATVPRKDGGRREIPVYVGKVAGELKVVR